MHLRVKYLCLTWLERIGDSLNSILLRIRRSERPITVSSDSLDEIDAWSEVNRNMMREILQNLSKMAVASNVDLVLCDGSLLGYVRNNSILPWDDDVDLAICDADMDRFLNLVIQDGSLLFDKFVFGSTGIEYYKFWNRDGEPIDAHGYTFPFVDIWIYKIENDKWVEFSGNLKFPTESYFPTKGIIFEGSAFKIPNHPLLCLDRLYSNWRVQIDVYSWSHRLERYSFKPLSVKIEVNEDGRFVKYL